MSKLYPPDTHHLSAAEGWFELGNPAEALRELNQLSSKEQERLEVLGLRWNALAQLKSWEDCICVSARILGLAPDNPFGWIHRSFALHELKRTQEARDLLLPAVEQFPGIATIPYNLACYECQLGNLETAWHWLEVCLRPKNSSGIIRQSLADADLAALWPRIARLKELRKK